MAENEDFAHQLLKQSAADYSLITQERTVKLDLLIHLLSNSNRPVVLCGSKGVGKTTLLTVFQQWQNEQWKTCLIQGRADLTLEQIQRRLTEFCPASEALAVFLERQAMLHKKIVLIIEDAGYLAPGLINDIIDYSVSSVAINVIFVLTHDDMAIKNHSDNAIEDSHIIEIPPLSKAQCGDFLQHLALKTKLDVPIQSITDEMLDELYQNTHGIPGQIITQMPVLTRPKKHNKTSNVLMKVLLGVIVVWAVSMVGSKSNLNFAWLSSLFTSLINK
jgi:DamX protein